ncbi:hypothetical protein DM02DRAFT_661583 [Periconia macrospinosa]|uniref:Uncharacterized protein n=1 Tax=Periconia macrospinosa TaxID=97972 RepID=A0A2V1D719_9PLEO|nr:hypothetical protein DM02DRAFT_661583 [Periconia macrospinosa]
MSFSPETEPQLVRKGWWRNVAAPAYRQYLWTTTNARAVLIVGLLAALEAFAGDRLWTIIRYYSQQADNRSNLSRSNSIRALYTQLNDQKQNLTNSLMMWKASIYDNPKR